MPRNTHSLWSMLLAFALLSGIVSGAEFATCTGAI